MNRVWYLTELEQGFLLEVHSEVNRGQLSQFVERHAVDSIQEATRLIIEDYRKVRRERDE